MDGGSKELALKVFGYLCDLFDSEGWRYSRNGKELEIGWVTEGEDFCIPVTITVDEGLQSAVLISQLPFRVREAKRMDVAVGVAYLNNRLSDGVFDYDLKNGYLSFRISRSFIEGALEEKTIRYMIYYAYAVVEEFNERLHMLSTGIITFEKFMAFCRRAGFRMFDESSAIPPEVVFGSVCGSLKKRGWLYQAFPEKLMVGFSAGGYDLEMRLACRTDPDKQIVRLIAPLTFNVPEERRLDAALATNCANCVLPDGAFALDLETGGLRFGISASWSNGAIGERLLDYLIDLSCFAVKNFNDKLQALAEGSIGSEDFPGNGDID